MPFKTIKTLGATGISLLFVMLGIYLFNKDTEYTTVKIAGLANIIFFGCIAILGLYTIVKDSAKK